MREISILGPCLVKLALMKCLHQHWCLVVADQCSDGILGWLIFNIRDPKNIAKYIEILLTSHVYSTLHPLYLTIYTKTKTQRPFFSRTRSELSWNFTQLSSWSRSSTTCYGTILLTTDDLAGNLVTLMSKPQVTLPETNIAPSRGQFSGGYVSFSEGKISTKWNLETWINNTCHIRIYIAHVFYRWPGNKINFF